MRGIGGLVYLDENFVYLVIYLVCGIKPLLPSGFGFLARDATWSDFLINFKF